MSGGVMWAYSKFLHRRSYMKESKKHLIKLFLFPISIGTALAIVWKIVANILDLFQLNWEGIVAIFFISGLIVVVVELIVNFGVNLPAKGKTNVYLMIATPEDETLDKFISDISDGLQWKTEDINCITPNYFRRYNFYKYANKNKGDAILKTFWFKKFLRITKANVIICGKIVKRKQGEDQYVVNLGLIYTLHTYKLDKQTVQGMKDLVRRSFNGTTYISINDEIFGYKKLTNYLSELVLFVSGLSELSAGRFDKAFEKHNELYEHTEMKLISRKKLQEILAGEAYGAFIVEIMKNNYDSVAKYVEFINKHTLAGSKGNPAMIMLQSRTKEELFCNAKECLKIVGKTNEKDPISLANKGYLNLIMGRYKQSEKNYNSFFKLLLSKNINYDPASIITYCKCAYHKEFEKKYSAFLLGMFSLYYFKDFTKSIQYFEEVMRLSEPSDYMYARSLELIEEAKNEQSQCK